MSTVTTPARARTDAEPRQAPVTAPAAPTTGLRLTGVAVTALAGVNTAFLAIFAGNWSDPFSRTMTELAGLALQLAIILLLLTMWRTRAVGSGIVWRCAGAITTALAMTAVAASIARLIMPESDAVLSVLNWSMLLALAGLYVVSLGVVAAGAWRGLLRYLPMALSSWGVVVVIATMIGDGDAAWWMLMYHLSIGTVLNGVALASRPDLTRGR
jgi:MFS family permease